jgi:hypothetical protein
MSFKSVHNIISPAGVNSNLLSNPSKLPIIDIEIADGKDYGSIFNKYLESRE